MAEEIEEQENEEGEVKEKKPLSARTKLIIWIVAGLLLFGGAIAGTLLMLGFFDSGVAEEELVEGSEVAEVVDNKPIPAMYFPIKPAFVVNFQSKGRQRFLQVDVSVLTRDMDVFNGLQSNGPLVKNRLVMLFSGEIYEELQTNEGKELLRQKTLEALQDLMQQEVGKTGVEEVLFTSFVMQ